MLLLFAIRISVIEPQILDDKKPENVLKQNNQKFLRLTIENNIKNIVCMYNNLAIESMQSNQKLQPTNKKKKMNTHVKIHRIKNYK